MNLYNKIANFKHPFLRIRNEHRASMTTWTTFTAYICTSCSKLLLLCWWIRTSSYYVLLLWRLGTNLYSCIITSLLTHLAAPPRLRFAKRINFVTSHQGQIHFLLPSWAVISVMACACTSQLSGFVRPRLQISFHTHFSSSSLTL